VAEDAIASLRAKSFSPSKKSGSDKHVGDFRHTFLFHPFSSQQVHTNIGWLLTLMMNAKVSEELRIVVDPH